MGRGRAKAKQTKVARELKYHSGGTDLDRLRAELAGEPVVRPADGERQADASKNIDDEDDEYTDPYADDLDDDPDDSSQDHRTA